MSRLGASAGLVPTGSYPQVSPRTPMHRTPTHSAALAANRARRARKRRRDVFLALCCLAVASLVLGLLPGFRALLMFHAAVDVSLGLYTMALLRRRSGAFAPAPSRAALRPAPRRYAAQGSGAYELGAAYALASND